jgi:hypothetical protein
MNIDGSDGTALVFAFSVLFMVGLMVDLATEGVAWIVAIAMILVATGGITAVMSLRAYSKSNMGLQSAISATTSFPSTPPPSKLTVRCTYCGAVNTFSETCRVCGAPLPPPHRLAG